MISLPFQNKTGGLFVTIKTFPSRTCVGLASETLLRELGSCHLTADGLAGSLYQCVKKGGFVLQLLRKNCDSTGVTEPEFRESREMLIRNNDCIFASSINRWVTIQCNDANIIEKKVVSPLSSSLTSLGGGANFEFRVLSRSDEALRSLPISTLSSQYARVQMRSAAGPSSTCFVPKVSSNDVSSGSTADDKDATKSARVRSVSDLLLGDDQSRCVFRQIGFWTFEVCAGLQVRQFRQHVMTAEHGMSASSSAPTTPLPDGSMGPQNLIGNFDQGNEEIIVTSTGELALRHIYANGADGRSATVLYICEPLNMDPAQTVDLLSVVESPTLTYTILVGVRNDAICGLIPSPSRLIAPFNRSCFEHIEGWWTYSICFGLYIRQFHAEQGTGKPVQESLIGNFDWARGEEFERGSLGSAPAITQHFNKGAACDIKNSEPREAFIRFECLPFLNDLGNAGAQGRAQPIAHVIVGANTLSLLSIKEAPSCVYTITIGSNSVCSHPEISASQIQTAPPPPTLVYCVMNDEEVDEIDDDELLI